MKKQFVNLLQEGDVVNDYFVATRKDLRNTQSGGKFLGLVFRDKTGEIGGVVWNNAETVAGRFELGDVVNVRATVGNYQGRLQLRVDQILPLKQSDYDPADLMFVPDDAGDGVQKMIQKMRTLHDPWLLKLADAFLGDRAFMDKFANAAAGKKWHHAYPGGLAQHCHEMTRIAELMCELFPAIHRDLLMVGIFLHDLGKTEELSQGLYIDYTTVGKLVGHLAIGLDMANAKMRAIEGFPEGLRAEIQHLILSHHATLEQGSPIVPKTLEAIVLALIDDLDAQTDAFNRVVEESQAKGQNWSEYITMIDRQIWAGRHDQS
jgi:3'-5' exoribonuclease